MGPDSLLRFSYKYDKGMKGLAHMNRKQALITGSSRGIGRGIALSLASNGYNIVVHHFQDQDKAYETIKLLQKFGARVMGIDLDLSQPEHPAQLIDQVLTEFGQIDLLVNNAGITKLMPLEDVTPEELDYVYQLDFRAPFICTQKMLSHMKERESGNIINITSIHQSEGALGSSVYGSMKAALKRFTETSAYDAAPYGIRVNSIAPGKINVREEIGFNHQRNVGAIPLRRVGMPEDIGELVRWLDSSQASYITGQSIYVDGGLSIPQPFPWQLNK